MDNGDLTKLVEDVELELLAGAQNVVILGLTPVTVALLRRLTSSGLLSQIASVHTPGKPGARPELVVPVASMAQLAEVAPDVVVVASDEDKEQLLEAALPYLTGAPRVVLAGYGHLAFRDRVFEEERANLLVPSLANGYQHSLTHLYQCLVNASRLGLEGVVAEFGMFKGGTTMFLSRVVERLGQDWRVVGFDSFSGFPPRRSALDMYDHPDCVFTDLDSVRRYFAGRQVDIVAGDIVQTASKLENEDVVVSFVDTDNYSSAVAALDVVQERTVVGGAIVFDHFAGDSKFRYTLGERMAGSRLLDDPRYFNLHGTGVFYRQAV
ncbi:TylF/MycF/NovP-related O-methyltransferase [Kribbella endophytica]